MKRKKSKKQPAPSNSKIGTTLFEGEKMNSATQKKTKRSQRILATKKTLSETQSTNSTNDDHKEYQDHKNAQIRNKIKTEYDSCATPEGVNCTTILT